MDRVPLGALSALCDPSPVNVLIYGNTETSPSLRHEIPLAIIDPFLYLETEGRRAVLTNSLEDARIAQAASGVERLLDDALGLSELIAEGRSRTDVDRELCVRAVAALGIHEASVPVDFPLALADRLREADITLTPDEAIFRERRREKTEGEMAGIRRAATVACQAMADTAGMFRESMVEGDSLVLGGELLTAERVRERIREVCARAGAPPPALTKLTSRGSEDRPSSVNQQQQQARALDTGPCTDMDEAGARRPRTATRLLGPA